jgi:predicted kinase
LRLAGDPDRLARAREDFQELMADRAFAEYRALRPHPRPADAPRPRAVLVAGVPGTGKSTLAEGLGRALRAPVFSMDWELGALVPFGVVRPDNMVPMAEQVMVASLARQLQLGLDVVLDATASRAADRERPRLVAEALDAEFVGVECVCSDLDVQRSRVEGRSRGIPGWPATVAWEHVLRMRDRWEPWSTPHLVVDSAVEPADAALARVLTTVRAGAPAAE